MDGFFYGKEHPMSPMSVEKMNAIQEQEPVPKMLVLDGLHHHGGGDYLDVRGVTMLEILFGHEPNPAFVEGIEGATPYRQKQFKNLEEIRTLAEQHGFLFVSDPNVTDNSVWSDEVKHMVWAPPTRKFYRFLKEEQGPVILGGITLKEVDARMPDKQSLLEMLERPSGENEDSDAENLTDKLFYQVLIEDMLQITPVKLEERKDLIGTDVSFITQLLKTDDERNKGIAFINAHSLIYRVINLFAEKEGLEKAEEAIKNNQELREKDPETVIFYALSYVMRDFVEKHFGLYESEMFENVRTQIVKYSRTLSDNAYVVDIDVERALCTSVQ